MRRRACIAVAASLALAGCGPGDAEPGATAPPADAGDPAALPAPDGGPPSDGGVAPLPTGAAGPGLRVWYKGEPSLADGTPTAERWVSPSTFTASVEGVEAVLELRAQLVDERRRGRDVTATWVPADATLLEVSDRLAHGIVVRIGRSGRTSLRVEHPSGLAVLVVRAIHDGRAWRVDVTQ